MIPFQTIDWESVGKTEHKGETGTSFWRTLQYDGIRIRMVEYSPGYFADHWCKKGHIIYCIRGKMTTELQNGKIFKLRAGMTYHVGDGSSSHRSFTKKGCILFIVD